MKQKITQIIELKQGDEGFEALYQKATSNWTEDERAGIPLSEISAITEYVHIDGTSAFEVAIKE